MQARPPSCKALPQIEKSSANADRGRGHYRCPGPGQSSAQPLGGGERAALVTGCGIQGGRLPSAQGQRTSEPGLPATHGADPAQAGDWQEAGHSRQAQARGLGFSLLGDGPRNGGDLDAIALGLVGDRYVFDSRLRICRVG